jgi:sulfate adenylyltransferase subunit 1
LASQNFIVRTNSIIQITADNDVKMNDIARMTFRNTKPLLFDSYRQNRITGAVIFIDEGANETVGVGMIE